MIHKVKMTVQSFYWKISLYRSLRGEVRKFQDPKRKAIYKKITLTSEQMHKIDNLYIANYGKKIPHTWHRHYMAFTGDFDEKFFPEILYIPRFEKFMNLEKSYMDAYNDKNLLPYIAKAAGVKMPKTIVSCVEGLYKDGNGEQLSREVVLNILSNAGNVFCKPTVDTGSGQGCVAVDFQDARDQNSGKTIADILDTLGENFVVQERIVCHESVAKLHPKSCNTFRIITYRWRDEICFVPGAMRIGRHGNFLDNAHAGGVFVAVDDDGTLHDIAFSEFREAFKEHPDSHIKFDGYQIAGFPKVLEAAKRMHGAMAQLGCIAWDFTLDEGNEPLLIEANTQFGGMSLIQMSHGKGLFGERTAEILRWIELMEKCNFKDLKKHQFGKM